MLVSRTPQRRRPSRGTTLILTAALMPMIVGGLAVSVDVAVLATARAQIHTVADAAALAGAIEMADRWSQQGYVTQADLDAARQKAIDIAARNTILGRPAVLLPDDITFGPGASPSFPVNNLDLLDTTDVVAARDESHAGVVPSFFSRVLGYNGSRLALPSQARAQNYKIQGFRFSGGDQRTDLLPIVLHEDDYQRMMETENANLYPIRTGAGNWGTINIGVSNNSTKNLGDQIEFGIKPEHMLDRYNNPIVLDPDAGITSLEFGGDTGISNGIKDNLERIIGKPKLVPIYTEASGPGNNMVYKVVGFAGIRITKIVMNGNLSVRHVDIAPAALNVSGIIPNLNQQVGWDQSGVIRVHLTQ